MLHKKNISQCKMSNYTGLLAKGKELIISKDYSTALEVYTKIELHYKENTLINDSDEELPQYYFTEYMILLLLNVNYNAAKYLWKRLPVTCKENSINNYISNIWDIGKYLFKNDTSLALGVIISTTYPDELSFLINDLQNIIIQNKLITVSNLYSNISIKELSSELHLEATALLQKTNEMGWSYDSNSDILSPVSANTEDNANIEFNRNIELLRKISDYTTQLERKSLTVDLSGKAAEKHATEANRAPETVAASSDNVIPTSI